MINMLPTFSIIIPAYNSQDYIDYSVKSVLNQTYRSFELIIINDGSFDNTLSIARNYEKKDNRVKVYSKKNGGYVSAVNLALSLIKGDYFILLGSDDYLNTNLLQTIADSIHKENVLPDIVVFKTEQIDGCFRKLDDDSNFEKHYVVEDDHFFENIKDNNNGIGLLCHRDTSKAFSTRVLNGLRYYGKYGVASDDFFTMSFSRRSSVFLFVPIVGYYWIQRSNSVGSNDHVDYVEIDTFKVCDLYFANLNKKSLLNVFEVDYLVTYYYRVVSYIRSIKFVISNYLFIKYFYFHCYRFLKKVNTIKFRHRLAFIFPLLFCCAANVVRN